MPPSMSDGTSKKTSGTSKKTISTRKKSGRKPDGAGSATERAEGGGLHGASAQASPPDASPAPGGPATPTSESALEVAHVLGAESADTLATDAEALAADRRGGDGEREAAHAHRVSAPPVGRAAAEEPSGLALLWRPGRWVLLGLIALYVLAQVLGLVDRTMRTTTVGGAASASSAGSTVKAAPGEKVRVTIQGLNLRTQPSVGGGVIIRKLDKGTTVELLARKSGWFQVRAPDGTKGWVVDRKGYTELVD